MLSALPVETMAPDASGRAADLPAEGAGAVCLFDATLCPNRSLPNSGFIAIMLVVLAANVFLGAVFLALGAWPILWFCGLDVVVVWLAFKVSYRQGRLKERIRVTRNAIMVARVLPSGRELRWQLQPFWTKVLIKRPIDEGSHVRVVSKGRTLIVGAFLSPSERGDFAAAFAAALATARHNGMENQ